MGFENISVDFIYGIPGYPNRDIKGELYSLTTKPFHISVTTLPLKINVFWSPKKKNKLEN